MERLSAALGRLDLTATPQPSMTEPVPQHEVYLALSRRPLDTLAGGVPPTRKTNLEWAQVPPRYIGARFETFEVLKGTAAARNTAHEWASSELRDRGFVLCGAPGGGKTHLAVAALAARDWPGMRFVNVPLFLDRMRQAIRFSESEVMDRFEYLCSSASVVVLDDLGKERATDWATERLYVLVESRYSQMLSTIATSNRSPNELDEMGYGALVSRLQESGPIVVMSAADYRMRKGAAR